MTITKYTFFSPTGTEYPVTSNADAKLYMMLSGFDYRTFGRTDWTQPKEAGLTKTYTNTSLVVAGRYMELHNHLITLNASTTNYVHVAINLSTPNNPVSITIASADQSNTLDINNVSGVYKRCIEVIETSGGSIVKTTKRSATHLFDDLNTTKLTATNSYLNNLDVSGNVHFTNGGRIQNKLWVDDLQSYGSIISKNLITTEGAQIGGLLSAKNLESKNVTTTNTLVVKGVKSQRSAQFQTPTTYASITGTALEEFLLYRNGNVITGTFADIIVDGGIPTGGAIIGWITDNDFKPQYTQKFSMYTRFGKRMMLSVDPGGAFRNWGDPIAKGDEIYGGVFWICKGTEGGLGS